MKFTLHGVKIEVRDKDQAAKLEGVADRKSYSANALSAAAPALMRAVTRELETVTSRKDMSVDDIKQIVVEKGRAKAECKHDRRRGHDGTALGKDPVAPSKKMSVMMPEEESEEPAHAPAPPPLPPSE